MANNTTRLNRASIPMTAKKIHLMMKRGNMTFDNPVQRPLTWDKVRKSNLVHSLIEGYPIPPLYARKENDVYDFLDGKQRLNTVNEYMSGDFALVEMPIIVYESDETGEEITIDTNGMYFSDLPEELRDAISEYNFLTYYFEGITTAQVRTIFQKLNNGKPLSTQAKNIAYCSDLENVTRLGSHELFEVILTNKSLESRKQIPMVMKIWTMLNVPNPSFESKVFNNIMQNTIISEEESKVLDSVFGMLMDVYSHIEMHHAEAEARAFKRRLCMETHLVAFAPFAKRALDEGIDDEKLSNFFCYFYNGDGCVSISDKYNETCKGGSAKQSSIAIRNEELEIAWNTYFKKG